MKRSYPLPGILSDIARLTSEEAALLIALHHGGTRLSVPKHVNPEGPIAKLVGKAAAAKISAEYGGERLPIPLAKPALILWRRDRGDAVSAIALELKVNERTVYEITAPPADERQAKLFA